MKRDKIAIEHERLVVMASMCWCRWTRTKSASSALNFWEVLEVVKGHDYHVSGDGVSTQATKKLYNESLKVLCAHKLHPFISALGTIVAKD